MFEVLLRADPRDGNDPIEAEATLPMVPRKGDQIEVWDPQTGGLGRDREGRLYHNGSPQWLDVENVVLCAYAPERVEVWVRLDSYDRDELERVMKAADSPPADPGDRALFIAAESRNEVS